MMTTSRRGVEKKCLCLFADDARVKRVIPKPNAGAVKELIQSANQRMSHRIEQGGWGQDIHKQQHVLKSIKSINNYKH